MFIWADTGVQVSVDEYFDSRAYQMMMESPVEPTTEITLAEEFARDSPLIESVQRVNSTVGLVYGTELPDSTVYGIDNPIYTYGLKDAEVLFVNEPLLNEMRREFTYEGDFSLDSGEALVSRQFIRYVRDVFGVTLTLNSTFDLELLMKAPSGPEAPIGDLSRTSLESLSIAGIYEIQGYEGLIETAFPSRMRSNYDYVLYDTPVLGIRDSVMVLSEGIGLDTIVEEGFFGSQTFLRASSTTLVSLGSDSIAKNLINLKAQMDQRFDLTVQGLSEVLYLQALVDTYVSSTPLVILNLPIFLLALFLSVFAADTFMAARRPEVSSLRAKGASSSQIYGIFISEAVVMAAVSMVFGMILSILFAALMPATSGFMSFNWEEYMYYLSSTVIKPETILYTIIICLLPPLLFILNSARKAAQTEIGTTLVESAEPPSEEGGAYGFTIGASVILLAMVIGAVLFLPANPTMLMLELGLGTAAWFFLAYNGSRYSRLGFARLSSKISFVLGEKNIIAAGNLKMRKGRIVPLMVVLALTLSSTIAFTVQAYSFQQDLAKEIDYSLGADLRVTCTNQPFSFNDTIEEYPGVKRALPILKTYGQVGQEMVTIAGLDPIEYSLVGHFDGTSFGERTHEEVLSELEGVEEGIVLSRYHANRWNKSIGDALTLQVGGRLGPVLVTFRVVGFVHTSPGLGYAAETDIPNSRLGAGFGLQAAYSGFAMVNLDYLSEETELSTTTLFLADLVCVIDQDFLLRSLGDLPGVSATTPDAFNLRRRSFGTALFLSTIEGLFSIGFAMSFLLSLFALTLFLGSVVRERKRDYAILRAVGSSKKQVVRVVLAEFSGVVLASVTLSLVLGTIFGFIMSVVVFSMSPFSRALPAAINFPTGLLTVVLLLEVLAMIGGSYFPAREASKTDPAIVLRNL
jgi:putative ABC transport system permease protein